MKFFFAILAVCAITGHIFGEKTVYFVEKFDGKLNRAN